VSKETDEVDLAAEFAGGVRRYAEATEEVLQEARRRTSESARAYARAVQEIQQQQQQALSAGNTGDYQETIRSFQSAAQDGQQRWQEAAREYQDAAKATADELAQRLDEAFRAYVASIKNAWALVDPATIDGTTIAAIQQATFAAVARPGGVAS
jgi:hypothetical protein